jgi:peptide chain release factor subunit 1
VSARQAEEHGLLLFASPDISRLVYPPQRVPHSLYLCDCRFHTDMLEEMIAPTDKVGFAVCDGQTAMVATVSGRRRHVHGTLTSAAKSRSRRGGQSAVRFERLRDHAEHDYIKAIGELMLRSFVGMDERAEPTALVTRIILAGPAGIKNLLYEHCQTLPHLPALLSGLITTTHVGMVGLAEAANRAGPVVRPSPHLLRFLEHVGDPRVCYGPDHVYAALVAGAVEVLLLDRDAAASLQTRMHTGVHTLVDWCVRETTAQGAQLAQIVPHCGEAVRFATAFGGLGALLRWDFDTGAALAELEETAHAAGGGDSQCEDETHGGERDDPVGAPGEDRDSAHAHALGDGGACAAPSTTRTRHAAAQDTVPLALFRSVSLAPPPPLARFTQSAQMADRPKTPEQWDKEPSMLPPGLTAAAAADGHAAHASPIPAMLPTPAPLSRPLNPFATEFVPGRVWGAPVDRP